LPRLPSSTLFPYTTLFRSKHGQPGLDDLTQRLSRGPGLVHHDHALHHRRKITGQRARVLVLSQLALLLGADQHLVIRLLEAGECGGDALADLFFMGRELHRGVRDEAAFACGVSQGHLQLPANEPANGVERGAWLVQQREPTGRHPVAVAVHASKKQLLLVSEGLVEAAAVDVHGRDEILDRGSLIALAPEQLDCLVERCFGIKLFRSRHAGSLFSFPPAPDASRLAGGVCNIFWNDQSRKKNREQPGRPSCSQSPHDETVIARCAQLRAAWPLSVREG